MQDLTEGSIPGHIAKLAIPIAIGMVFQTLYYLVDLFFVGRISETAMAGLTSAGNVQFLIMALTQVLGVGTMALIAQASGRKDQEDANLIFNQSLLMGAVCAGITLLGGYGLSAAYMRSLAADQAVVEAGTTYLNWFLPGLALQFALISMGSALRGTGVVKPTIVVQIFTVVLNAILAPFMIAGWLTGRPLGVMGAGLSSTISVAVAVILMTVYFVRLERFVRFDMKMFKPRLEAWARILKIGLPPGGEFALMFVFMAVTYWAIRGFGAEAQAGFGAGSRMMQAIFLPAMAVAFATAPVAGQNFGAGHFDRVRGALRAAAIVGSAIMLTLTLLCQIAPDALVGWLTDDPAVVEVGGGFLQIISWNFVAIGLIFTCSGIFQALGNTLPSLMAGAARLLMYAIPAVWLAGRPDFALRQLWILSVATATLQAVFSWWLLQREFRTRLVESVDPGLGAPSLATDP